MSDRISFWLQRLTTEEPIRFLLVEDCDEERDALLALCRRRGIEVASAESGEAALPLLKDHHYDAALVNLSLPGMSGLDFIRQMRKTAPGLPAVVVTGFDPGVLGILGITHVFHKPFTDESLDSLLLDFQLTDTEPNETLEWTQGLSQGHPGRATATA